MTNLKLDLASKLQIIENESDAPSNLKSYSFKIEKIFKNGKVKYSCISPMNDCKKTSFHDTVENIEKKFSTVYQA